MNDSTISATPGLRTVLHLSPAVCAAAIASAQQAGMNLQDWLDHRVAYALVDDTVMIGDCLDAIAPWSLASADLFVSVVNGSPEVLKGRWALLYERVKGERSLWTYPTQTVEQADAGDVPDFPYLSLAKVRAVWPRLCASTFCM